MTEPAPAPSAPTNDPSPKGPGPLSVRAFRWVFSGALVSNIGVWMQSVLAGFVMAQLTHVPSLVAAMPLAVALPAVVFALPAGAIADATDRRMVLLVVKTLVFATTLGLAAITALGALTPFALLTFTTLLGVAATFNSPAWWGMIASLVPERMLTSALSLDGLQWNVGQMLGPIAGGALLAAAGPAPMFFVAAGLTTIIVGVLVVWRGRGRTRLTTPVDGAAERMIGAMAAGARYLTHAPALQVACWRTMLFVAPATALSSLLPLYAAKDLHLGGVGYGLLLSAIGAGSVLGALVLPRLRVRLHLDVMMVAASVLSGAATAAVVLVPGLIFGALALAATGFAWLVAVTTLNLAAQQAVPEWVRSRALGAYLMAFQCSVVAGALVWGFVADGFGVRTALVVSALTFVPGVVLTRWLGLPVVAADALVVAARSDPELAITPEAEDGPVLVLVNYEVDPDAYEEFIEALDELRVVRRRTGATRWSLFEDAERPGYHIESFVVGSWSEYLRQRNRYTTADLRVLDTAMTYHNHLEDPEVRYFIHPESITAYRRRARWRRLRGYDRALGPPPAPSTPTPPSAP